MLGSCTQTRELSTKVLPSHFLFIPFTVPRQLVFDGHNNTNKASLFDLGRVSRHHYDDLDFSCVNSLLFGSLRPTNRQISQSRILICVSRSAKKKKTRYEGENHPWPSVSWLLTGPHKQDAAHEDRCPTRNTRKQLVVSLSSSVQVDTYEVAYTWSAKNTRVPQGKKASSRPTESTWKDERVENVKALYPRRPQS